MTTNQVPQPPTPTSSTAAAEAESQNFLLARSGPYDPSLLTAGKLTLTTKYDEQINAKLKEISAIGKKFEELETSNLPPAAAQLNTARGTYGDLFSEADYQSAQESKGYSGGATLQTWEKLLSREISTTVSTIRTNYDTNTLQKGQLYAIQDEQGNTWKFRVENRLGRDRISIWNPAGKFVSADLSRDPDGNAKDGSTSLEESAEAVRYLRALQKALKERHALTPVAS